MSRTPAGRIDHRGIFTYPEAFARLADGGWLKVDERNHYTPAGQLCLEAEVWVRDGFDGPEWAAVKSAPWTGQTAARWHLTVYDFDPRVMYVSPPMRGELLPDPLTG
jgi:hypothetical protein